jgi:NADPH:quinone reductase-like Zn-dependent oxidoreductase
MNAAVVQAFDTPPSYRSFDEPVAQAGEMPVKVLAAGLHPIVKALANGTHYGSTGVLPFIPGVDGVGRLEDGTRVFFGVTRPPYGSFAERALAASWLCLPVPDELDDAVCAGIANPAMSSSAALTARAKFVAGESVLILGATGVAGQLAVQIAKRRGARRVVAVGRNPGALEKLTTLGADAVISLELGHDALVAAFRKELMEFGVDVVLDYIWGSPAEKLLQTIAQKGLQKSSPRVRFIQIGNSAGGTISLAAATLRSSGLELLGSGFGSASLDEIRHALVEFFAEAAQAPYVFEVKAAPLSDVGALWNRKEEGARLVFVP